MAVQQGVKKPFYKKWWFWVIAVLVFFYVIGASSNKNKNTADTAALAPTTNTVTAVKEKSQPTTTKQAEEVKTVEEPKAVEEPKVDFSTMEVTAENIETAIKNVVGPDKYKSAEVTTEKGETIVDVYFDPGMVWDEKDLVKQTARTATATMEVLFTNPKIDKVWFWAVTKMTDAKGNEAEENVVNVCLTKENAKDINWPKFKDMVLLDYKKLFSIADSSFIYPSIAAKLD